MVGKALNYLIKSDIVNTSSKYLCHAGYFKVFLL